MKKRVGSILLCLCIVLTQLPVRVWAVEGVPPFPETEMGETSAPPAPKEEPACTCGAEPGEDGLTVHLPECPLYEEPEPPAGEEEPACTCGAVPGEDGLTVHLPECPLYEEPETPAEVEEPEPLEAPPSSTRSTTRWRAPWCSRWRGIGTAMPRRAASTASGRTGRGTAPT